MIVEKEFLNKIRDLGINSYEAKLWTALLSRGIATAGELSDIANVPRSRSYDVLESLERKGFIVMKLGKPIKYIAVPPHEVIDRVKNKILEEAKERDSMLDSLKGSEVLDQLHSLYSTGSDHIEPADVTGVIRGHKNIVSHISSVLKNAEKRVDILCPNHAFVMDMKRAISRAVKNDVKVRLLTSKRLALGTKSVTQKPTDNLQGRFIVVDNNEVVLLPVDAAGSKDFAVWVKGESFASNFRVVFDTQWA